MAPARPTERAVDPTPRAIISQPARAARPAAAAATAIAGGEFLALGFRRGGVDDEDRAGGRFADREVPFELVVRAPERAAVLFAMPGTLVPRAPPAP